MQAAAAPTPRPIPTPAPTAPGRTDAEKAAIVLETIDQLYCGSAPVADWCPQLFLKDGKPVVEIDGTSLFLTMQQRTPEALAMSACKAIATAHFDENAKPLGYRHVHVWYGSAGKSADCDIPAS